MRNKLTVGAIWMASGRLLINLVGLASTVVLARLLTPDDFGVVAIALVLFAIASAFSELSLSAALIQHRDPQREFYDTAWTLNIIRALAISAVLVISAFPVAKAYGDPRLIEIMFALGFSALVVGLVNPKLVDFRRRLSFKQEILAELASKVVGFVVGAGIAYAYRTYWALVIGTLAAQITSLLLSYVLIPFKPRFSLQHWRTLFSFSGWLVLRSGVDAINYRADRLVIGAVLGTAQLGQYTVGDNLASLPVRESTAPLAQMLFPAFSHLQDDTERMRETFLRSQSLLVAAALPVGVGFALIATPLVLLVLGPQWTSVALVIEALSTIFAAQAFSAPLTPLAMGLGRTRLLFLREIFYLIVRYPLIFAGLFAGGLQGLLLARCVSGLLGVGVDAYLAQRLVGAHAINQFLSNWRALAATSVMAVSVWSVSAMGVDRATYLDLSLLVMTGAISYFGTTLALWLAAGKPHGPEQELLDLLQFLRRPAASALGFK